MTKHMKAEERAPVIVNRFEDGWYCEHDPTGESGSACQPCQVEYVTSEIREAEQAARDDAFEESAATQCKWCRDSVPVELRDVTAEYDDAEGQILFWQHRFLKDERNSWMDCSAHAIRARKEKDDG